MVIIMISQGNVIEVKIEEEMKKSYIDYAMSVIVGRALPDVRDGLKPVHRRILYSMYELEPVGRHKISICTNISCMLCGSAEVVAHFEKRLGIKLGETTADGKITLKEVECLGACVGAPMMQVNKDYIENLTPEAIDQLLAGLE